MNTPRIMTWICLLTFAIAFSTPAEDKVKTSKTKAQTEDARSATKNTPVDLKNQTHCPVMGGEIDSTVFTDIQGQRVYHCCPMCSKKLVANPDKFFKKASNDGVLFENIQESCPVSEMKLIDSVFTDYMGRRIFFGSVDCRDKFLKEPAKYLAKMKQAPDGGAKATKPASSKENAQSHDHKHGQNH